MRYNLLGRNPELWSRETAPASEAPTRSHSGQLTLEVEDHELSQESMTLC